MSLPDPELPEQIVASLESLASVDVGVLIADWC